MTDVPTPMVERLREPVGSSCMLVEKFRLSDRVSVGLFDPLRLEAADLIEQQAADIASISALQKTTIEAWNVACEETIAAQIKIDALTKALEKAQEAVDAYESRFESISQHRMLGPIDDEMRALAAALKE